LNKDAEVERQFGGVLTNSLLGKRSPECRYEQIGAKWYGKENQMLNILRGVLRILEIINNDWYNIR